MEPKCRVCLSSASNVSISTLSQANIFMLKSIYSSFTVLNTNDVENLNDLKAYNNICSFCQTVLSLLYEFQQKVARSEHELLQRISGVERNSEAAHPDIRSFIKSEFDSGDGSINENYVESSYRPDFEDHDETSYPFNSVYIKPELDIDGEVEGEVYETTPDISTGLSGSNTRIRKRRRPDSESKRFQSGSFYTPDAASHLTLLDDELKKYSCNLCDKILFKKIYALQHVHYEHLADQTTIYRCELCSYCTPKKFNLTVHMAKHQPDNQVMATEPAQTPNWKPDKPLKKIPPLPKTLTRSDYTVSKGDAELNWTDYLTETQLGDGIKYSCTLCSKEFTNKRHAIDHVRETHFRHLITNYNCTKCSFSTPRKYNLSIHLRKHAREEGNLLKPEGSTVDQSVDQPTIPFQSESEDVVAVATESSCQRNMESTQGGMNA